jgi:ABC-type phosphonate transport system ATPase subunit
MTVLSLTDCEWSWVSPSPEHSLQAGEALGRLLRPGDFLALFGELGSGKTLFVRGVAAGLGCAPEQVHIRVSRRERERLRDAGGQWRRLAHIGLFRIRSETRCRIGGTSTAR